MTSPGESVSVLIADNWADKDIVVDDDVRVHSTPAPTGETLDARWSAWQRTAHIDPNLFSGRSEYLRAVINSALGAELPAESAAVLERENTEQKSQ